MPAIPAITKAPFNKFLPGITTCFLNNLPESLPQATTEPVNATAPIAIVSPRVISVNASVLVASVDIY